MIMMLSSDHMSHNTHSLLIIQYKEGEREVNSSIILRLITELWKLAAWSYCCSLFNLWYIKILFRGIQHSFPSRHSQKYLINAGFYLWATPLSVSSPLSGRLNIAVYYWHGLMVWLFWCADNIKYTTIVITEAVNYWLQELGLIMKVMMIIMKIMTVIIRW